MLLLLVLLISYRCGGDLWRFVVESLRVRLCMPSHIWSGGRVNPKLKSSSNFTSPSIIDHYDRQEPLNDK